MAHVNPSGGGAEPTRESAPPTNRTLIVIAGVCLAIPVVALLWVSSYAKETPKLGGVPFFFWYQFLLVIASVVFTSIAFRLVASHDRDRRAAQGLGRGGQS